MQHLAPATIAVIGSVAGDRGRKSNYVYGAAKNLLATYIEGMQHRFAKTGLHILLIKPGPTSTPMTAHLKASGAALAEPDEVAADILNAVRKKSRVLYTPGKWQVIMFVIRCLPFAIFKHLNI
jgi:short-subunit dehydrogenase